MNSKAPSTGTTGTTNEGANAKIPGFKQNAYSGGTTGLGNTPRYTRLAALSRAISNAEAADVLESISSMYGIELV
ncbi:hypothetical protein M1D93_14885 [Arthrobacter sp. Z1-9]